MNKLIGCCGLNCENCDVRIATINNDDELRKTTAKYWSELNNENITPDMMNCMGCRMDDVKTVYCEKYCEIRKCVIKNNLNTCADCKDMNECKTLGMISNNNPAVLENLKLLKNEVVK